MGHIFGICPHFLTFPTFFFKILEECQDVVFFLKIKPFLFVFVPGDVVIVR